MSLMAMSARVAQIVVQTAGLRLIYNILSRYFRRTVAFENHFSLPATILGMLAACGHVSSVCLWAGNATAPL